MRGTDVTPEQLQSAREFLAARSHGRLEGHSDAVSVELPLGDLARIVAWYGAIRYQAGASGIGGTLERPGAIDLVDSAKAVENVVAVEGPAKPVDAVEARRLERALTGFVRARMPWPFEDVDRDGEEARLQAEAIARPLALSMAEEFEDLRRTTAAEAKA